MEKSSCALYVGIVMALVFIGGIVFTYNRNGQDQNGQQAAVVIAKIGDKELSLDALTAQVQALQQQNQAAGSSPEVEADVFSAALSVVVNQTIYGILAQQAGVAVSESDIQKAIEKAVELQVAQDRAQVVQQRKLPPTATPAEYDAYLQKQNTSLSKVKEGYRKELESRLSDPSMREVFTTSLMVEGLRDSIAKKFQPTDAELKAGFDKFTFKRIHFDPIKNQGKDVKAIAEKIKAELKAGATFESLMNKYSSDPPPAQGKPVSESTLDFPRSTIETLSEKDILLKMKPGEVTDLIDTNTGPGIYKLVKFQPDVPKDFDKIKADTAKMVSQNKANEDLSKRVKEFATSNIKWNMPSLALIYKFRELFSDQQIVSSKSKRTEAFKALDKEMEALQSTSEVQFEREFAGVRYRINQLLWQDATEQEKKAMRQSRLDIIVKTLQYYESVEMRLEATDLAEQFGNKEVANDQLTMAAQYLNDLTAIGQKQFGDIVAKTDKLEKSGVLTKESVKTIRAELDRWKKEKLANDKAMEEQAAEQKRLEAEQKKAEEEQRKKDEAAAKSGGATGTTGTTGATGGTGTTGTIPKKPASNPKTDPTGVNPPEHLVPLAAPAPAQNKKK